MRALVSFVALVSVLISGCTTLQSQSVTADSSFKKSVVKIACSDGAGTGVLLESGYILTAAHVVVGEKDCKAQAEDLTSWPVEIHKVDQKVDLALLSFVKGKPSAKGIPISLSAPPQYAPIVLIGHPLAIDLQVYSPGIYQGHLEAIYDLIGSSVTFGNSGGPILWYDGYKYVLVGIVDAIPDSNGHPTFHLGIIINLTTIKKFLADNS
jgi:serine protease Do